MKTLYDHNKLKEILEVALLWENEKKSNKATGREAMKLKSKLFKLLSLHGIYACEHNYRILGIEDPYFTKITCIDKFISEKESMSLWQYFYIRDKKDMLGGISYVQFLKNLTLEEFETITKQKV